MHFLSNEQVQAIADQPSPHAVTASQVVWSGRIVDMVKDHIIVVDGQEPVNTHATRVPLPWLCCAVRVGERRFSSNVSTVTP